MGYNSYSSVPVMIWLVAVDRLVLTLVKTVCILGMSWPESVLMMMMISWRFLT